MSKNQEILLTNSAVDFLKEEVGGSTVIANETLSGDEDTLTELTVEGVKYAVPQGGSGGGVMFASDIALAISGKTLNITKLKELFTSCGIDLTSDMPTHMWVSSSLGSIGGNTAYVLFIYNNGCDYSYEYLFYYAGTSDSTLYGDSNFTISQILDDLSGKITYPVDLIGCTSGEGSSIYDYVMTPKIYLGTNSSKVDSVYTFAWEDFFACFD